MQTTDPWQKPVMSTKDIIAVLPGEGEAILRDMIAAEWLAPCATSPAARPRALYSTARLRECLDRILNGEYPRPVWRWRQSLGHESAHLVNSRGHSACGSRQRDWFPPQTNRQCTRCQGFAKSENVAKEEA